MSSTVARCFTRTRDISFLLDSLSLMVLARPSTLIITATTHVLHMHRVLVLFVSAKQLLSPIGAIINSITSAASVHPTETFVVCGHTVL